MQEIPTILFVSAVALVDGKGQVLLQRRRISAAHGGLWEFPGGKLEPSEAPDIALVREIREELGIDLETSELEPVSFVSGASDGSDAVSTTVIFLYACRSWTGNPQCLDAEEIAWFEPASIAALEMPPLDYPLVDRLVGMLRHPRG